MRIRKRLKIPSSSFITHANSDLFFFLFFSSCYFILVQIQDIPPMFVLKQIHDYFSQSFSRSTYSTRSTIWIRDAIDIPSPESTLASEKRVTKRMIDISKQKGTKKNILLTFFILNIRTDTLLWTYRSRRRNNHNSNRSPK